MFTAIVKWRILRKNQFLFYRHDDCLDDNKLYKYLLEMKFLGKWHQYEVDNIFFLNQLNVRDIFYIYKNVSNVTNS